MTSDVHDKPNDKERMDPKEEQAWSVPGVDIYGQPLPPVDERLAPPETRVEYIGGVEYFAAPADEPHGRRHLEVGYVVNAHVAKSHTAAVEMLTRTDDASDFAPDVSVYPTARTPTGRRQLEELAFEVASEQSLSVPTRKARELARRGVRRVFCILVKQGRVLEWSRETDGWKTVPEDGFIDDPSFARPLPVAALLKAVELDDEVAKALIAKGNPVLEERNANTLAEGRAEGLRHGILAILRSRGLEPTESELDRLRTTTDIELLTKWTVAAATAGSIADLLQR